MVDIHEGVAEVDIVVVVAGVVDDIQIAEAGVEAEPEAVEKLAGLEADKSVEASQLAALSVAVVVLVYPKAVSVRCFGCSLDICSSRSNF